MTFREWLADNLEVLAFRASVLAAVLGGLAAFLVVFAWPRVAPKYQELPGNARTPTQGVCGPDRS